VRQAAQCRPRCVITQHECYVSDVSGVSDRPIEHAAIIALRQAAVDDGYVVESVMGRIHSIDTMSPTHKLARLRPANTLTSVGNLRGTKSAEATASEGRSHWHIMCSCGEDAEQCGDSESSSCLAGVAAL
jgi:hypothetical protein